MKATLVLAGLLVLAATGGLAIPWSSFIQTYKQNCKGMADEPCVIPEGVDVTVSADIAVRTILVYGTFWAQPSVSNKDLTITTAFLIASGKNAQINITAPNPDTTVKVKLIRNKHAFDDDLPLSLPQRKLFRGGRVFGGANGARIFVEGTRIKPHFTLLAKPVFSNCGELECKQDAKRAKIYVVDDVSSWPEGSTMVIAPSSQQYGLNDGNLQNRPDAFEAKIEKIEASGNGSWVITVDRLVPFYASGGYVRAENPMFAGDVARGIQSEVFILERNIVFTGQEFLKTFEPLPQPPWLGPLGEGKGNNGWPTPWSNFTDTGALVEGIHTIISGDNCTATDPCSSGGGWMIMRYARVQVAGVRGWIGRYPVHIHRMGYCPTCEVTGNVVYDTQQRGIVIHSTGDSLAQDNIVYNSRGAGIYIEEGTEIGNTVKGNVVVCGVGLKSYAFFDKAQKKWREVKPSDNAGVAPGGGHCQADSSIDFGDPRELLGGCRVTGTDNAQADCIQQAGIWALSATNNLIGNRIVNHYNGIYFQSTLFFQGRPGMDSFKKVCPIYSNWGTVKDNVCHSNGRFGFYPDVNYPRNVHRSVETHGYVSDLVEHPECNADLTNDTNWCSCRSNLQDGTDNGQQMTLIENEFDWGNNFVGQYDLADVQYLGYRSAHNAIAMYWKGSKMMNLKYDGILRPHMKNVTFIHDRSGPAIAEGHYPIAPWEPDTPTFLLNTPGISGTIVLEDVVFLGDSAGASWIRNRSYFIGAGGAIGVNQQCKGFMSGTNEGMLCTPQILLKNVDFSKIKDAGNNGPAANQPQDQRPTFIRFGAEAGNPYLGMVIAFDDSLCYNKSIPCNIRSVLPLYSTHLLNLPGEPCVATMKPYRVKPSDEFEFLPVNETGDLSRRYDNGVLCKVQTRRLTIWGQAQGESWTNPVSLVLIPPGKTKSDGFVMQWFAYNFANVEGQGPCPWSNSTTCCAGTLCGKDEPRRFAEGYGAAVIPQEFLKTAEPWKLVRLDDQPVDISKITMVEFSDVVFDGKQFPGPDSVRISLNGVECTLRSTDQRRYMSPFGPTRGASLSGGSCLSEWFRIGTRTSSPTTRSGTGSPSAKVPSQFPTKSPTRTPTTRIPTVFPSKTPVAEPTTRVPTSFPTKSPTRTPTTRIPTVFPSKTPVAEPTTRVPTSFPTKSPVTTFPTKSPVAKPTARVPTSFPTKSPVINPTRAPSSIKTTKSPTATPTKRPISERPSRPITAGPTTAPAASICRPENGLNQARCRNRATQCSNFGISMKWMGRLCNRGFGCQCAGFCNFPCRQGCVSNSPHCQWNATAGLCYTRGPNPVPGFDMPTCFPSNSEEDDSSMSV